MAKILIVDDSGLVRIQVRDVLERAGHEVLEAEDGEAGLQVAGANPDLRLVIADFNMPKLNGIQMLGEIRKLANHTHTPFMVLSTETSPALKSAGKEVGVLVWVVKPLVELGFVKTVEKVLTLSRPG